MSDRIQPQPELHIDDGRREAYEMWRKAQDNDKQQSEEVEDDED